MAVVEAGVTGIAAEVDQWFVAPLYVFLLLGMAGVVRSSARMRRSDDKKYSLLNARPGARAIARVATGSLHRDTDGYTDLDALHWPLHTPVAARPRRYTQKYSSVPWLRWYWMLDYHDGGTRPRGFFFRRNVPAPILLPRTSLSIARLLFMDLAEGGMAGRQPGR